jgi:hypothetical protein
MRFHVAAFVLALGLLSAERVWAQEDQPSPGRPAGQTQPTVEEMGADTDPTKPVLFTLREEFFNLRGDPWRNALILRVDQLVLKATRLPYGTQGVILRGEVPMASFSDGRDSETGLGDAYTQALLIARPKQTFFLAVGSGLIIPTATDDRLGMGKWIAAPAVVPVWFFPKRGFLFLKFQDWVSFAGDSDRPDRHFFTVTPTLLWRTSRRWWMLLDGESNTDWKRDNVTWYKAGFLVGRMFSSRNGFSLKLEIPFGDDRPSDWILKAVFFRTRF